jgi:hypothetical protein
LAAIRSTLPESRRLRDTCIYKYARNATKKRIDGQIQPSLDFRAQQEHFKNKRRAFIMAAEKFIIIPYKKARNGLAPGEMRQASNAASAEKIAAAMADRFIGVAAYAVMVDEETGDMTSPRLLARHGDIADLNP